MRPDGRRLGAHLPLGGGMVAAVERAAEIGANALQVFSDNPTTWRRRGTPSAELPAFRARSAALDIGPIAIHASYLVNLAGPEVDFFERSIGLLIAEARAAPGFGATLVNVHTGSHRDTTVEAGIERVADGIVRVLAEVDDRPDAVRIVLENAAGSGWAVGVTIEELALVGEAIARRGVPERRVGFCLDTAHLWAAGYRLDRPDAIDELFERFDATVGIGRLAMVHLNDSKAASGSRLDRHEHLGAGRIGTVGFAHLLRHPRLAQVPAYLETPGMDVGYDAVNMGRALALAAGRPLEPLPAEAFAVQGSRSRSARPSPVQAR